MKFIGFYNYTVILTYISLISGVLGMKFACDGNLTAAICCLAISGICDLFDGPVARSKRNRTADEKNFGIQLDSLCDIVCFGVLPAVFLYFAGVDTVYGIAFLVFYVLCALIRLAFFNVLETKRQTIEGGCAKFYRGVPVTTSAIIFPAVYVITLVLPSAAVTVVHHALPLAVGILFITDIRIPKFNVSKFLGKIFRSKKHGDAEDVCCDEKV